MHWKTKMLCDSVYCEYHFIVVFWDPISNMFEICPHIIFKYPYSKLLQNMEIKENYKVHLN